MEPVTIALAVGAFILSAIGTYIAVKNMQPDLAQKYLNLANETYKKYEEQLEINKKQAEDIKALQKWQAMFIEATNVGWKLFYQVKSRGDIPIATPATLPEQTTGD